MKRNFLLTVILLFGCTFIAAAQEESFPDPVEQNPERRLEENNPRESGMQMWEMERIQREVSSQNTSQNNKSSKDRVPEKPKEKAMSEKSGDSDESVLGFNFLYYLIQKFKLSESVD